MRGINQLLQEKGFLVGIPYYAFMKEISPYTVFVIEGENVKDYTELGYTLRDQNQEIEIEWSYC